MDKGAARAAMKSATKTSRTQAVPRTSGKKLPATAAAKTVQVQPSSGNVFADLSVPQPQEMLLKAQLADRICQVIAARGLTQTKAAELMALDQPKVSALRHGKLGGFSTERLFRCLNDLGQEVEITLRPAQQAGCRGNVRVVAVSE